MPSAVTPVKPDPSPWKEPEKPEPDTVVNMLLPVNVFEPVLANPKLTSLVSKPDILSADTDPDTICPPLDTTMYPEVLESNVTIALFTVLKVTLAGRICTLLSLYTATFTFLLSKL